MKPNVVTSSSVAPTPRVSSHKMKTTLNLLLATTSTALLCSNASAQISYSNTLPTSTLVYSNGFDGGAVNITNTAPDYASTNYGGTNTAVWVLAGGALDTGGNYYANGTVSDVNGDTIL